MNEFGAFVAAPDGFVLRLGPSERALIARMLAELRTLLLEPADGGTAAVLQRIFPIAHREDPEMEAEYQRLMRDELVASRVAGIDAVTGALEPDGAGSAGAVTFSEAQLLAFMQGLNGVRLVLGTMLDVSEDDSIADDTGVLAPEHHLYTFLSWVLDSAVDVLNPS